MMGKGVPVAGCRSRICLYKSWFWEVGTGLWLDTGVQEPDLGGERLGEGRVGTNPRR